MTLQWTLVALFLYSEIAFLLLLMLPWIRAPLWKKLFNSRLIKALELYSTVFYYATGGILLLLFFDAIREVRKYGGTEVSITDQYQTPHADTMIHMRLFRAQRNLYIAGFALFLYLVCRRMVQMIMLEANLMASNEASLKQAQGAAKAAQSLLGKGSFDKGEKTEDADFKTLTATVEKLKKELRAAEKDRDAIKEQAEGTKREYDRLLEEFDKVKGSSAARSKDD